MTSIIFLAGGENVGKTTTIEELKKLLQPINYSNIFYGVEPGGTERGKEIRKKLKAGFGVMSPEEQYALMWKARFYLCEEHIWPALNSGVTVVLDRSFFCTMAYQMILDGLDQQSFFVEDFSKKLVFFYSQIPKEVNSHVVLLERPSEEARASAVSDENADANDLRPVEVYERLRVAYFQAFGRICNNRQGRIFKQAVFRSQDHGVLTPNVAAQYIATEILGLQVL